MPYQVQPTNPGLLLNSRNVQKMRRLLSEYDRNDQVAGSCREALMKMTNADVKEIIIDNGGGHRIFRTPEAKWLDVLQAWAERRNK